MCEFRKVQEEGISVPLRFYIIQMYVMYVS